VSDSDNTEKTVVVPRRVLNQMINVCVVTSGILGAAMCAVLGCALASFLMEHPVGEGMRFIGIAIWLGLCAALAAMPIRGWWRFNTR
jgi:hypothetical protein